MNIKTPQFWRNVSLISLLLLPLSLAYYIAFKLMGFLRKRSQYVSKLKIVCIGNLIAGGAGKTPVALTLGRLLKQQGVNFAFLSSGYKGKGDDFIEVTNEVEAKKAGDEPILLSEVAPTYVAKNRVEGVKRLEAMGYELLILDDGLQNKSLYKDYKIVVIDGKIQFGNGLIFPSGPLRQTVKSGLNGVDQVIVIGGSGDKLRSKIEQKMPLGNIRKAKIQALNYNKYKNKKILAFCGIAYPEKFFNFIADEGLEVVATKSFSDHYEYNETDMEGLMAMSKRRGAVLLTTKKDWVRLDKKLRAAIDFLDIDLMIEGGEDIILSIKELLNEKNI